MILMASGDLKSCLYNASNLFKKVQAQMKKNLTEEKSKVDGMGQLKWTKSETFYFVNISFIYIKCLLLTDKYSKDQTKLTGQQLQQKIKEILDECFKTIRDGLVLDLAYIKEKLTLVYQEKIENSNLQEEELKSRDTKTATA